MRTLLSLLFVVLSLPAYAGTVCTDKLPPLEYYSMAVPRISGPFPVSRADLPEVCGDVILGCTTFASGDRPTVYYREDLANDPTRFACFMAHELAHANGWPGTHPHARWL